MTTAIKVGDRVRWRSATGWFVWELRGPLARLWPEYGARALDAVAGAVAPLSELTLVESAPSELGKSIDLLYGWERCSHEGIGKPGCSTCDPDKSRCVAKLERDLAQRDETIAELRKAQAAWLASPEAAKRLEGYRELGAKCADLEGQLQAARAKSEQRREVLMAIQEGKFCEGHLIQYDNGDVDASTFICAALSDDAPPKAEAARAEGEWAGLKGEIAGLKETLAQRDATIAELRAKSEQRREAHVPKYSTTSSWRPTWDELVAERNALKAEVARYEADALLLRRMFSEDERKLKAEVERLKAEAQAKMSGKFYVMSDAEVVTIEGLQADVGRLTGERDALKAENAKLRDAHSALETENDKLRDVHSAFNSNNIQLRAENAKLREALQSIACIYQGPGKEPSGWLDEPWSAHKAREALGVKVTP